MLLRFVAVGIVVLVCAVLVSLVLLDRQVGKKIKASFSVLSAGMILWQVTILLADLQTEHDVLFNRLVFLFPVVTLVGFLWFVQALQARVSQKTRIIDIILSVLALVIPLTPWVVTGVEPRVDQAGVFVGNNVSRGVLYPVFVLFIAVLGLRSVIRFINIYRTSDKNQKRQFRFVLYGFALTFVIAMITNLILPLIFGDSAFASLGFLSSIVFVGSLAYGITRHRFLDIRLAIARTIAYTFTLVTVAASYILLVFALSSAFLGTGNLSIGQQVLYVVVTLFLALTFPIIKRFFNKITNRLFYRDAYDPQQLFDSLNKTLVSTIELNSLLHRVAQIIASTLKVEFSIFSIVPGETKPAHLVAAPDGAKLSAETLTIIRKEAPNVQRKVLLADELEDHPKLQKAMRDHDIALIARLVDSPTQNQPGLGYLIMGNKKSGNPYSSEDARVMEIIADELVIAVQNALRFDEIRDFNLTLQERVEDATRKLRRTNEKLKQLDETKDDFISMASHQLRTPLTSVKGYVSMVLEGDAGKITPQQRKLLEQSFISSQRMVFLIADLLNVSRLKTGKFVIEPKPTNLAEIVGSEIDQLTETAKGRGLTLVYHKPADFPVLNLDETKTRQVIMNFIDNAIYYTPAGGKIEVSLVNKSESIEFTVVDNGLGVPKHEQPHLFTKFYRAANARKARPDGTGLGLFMAKKVIIAQGGAVIFKSQENKGSTFGFSFPKKKLLVK